MQSQTLPSHLDQTEILFSFLSLVSDRAGARLITQQKGHADLGSARGVIQKSMLRAARLATLQWRDDGRLLLSGCRRHYL